ncbi:protein TOXD [Aspergillus campestris IBT 28561]|uniref:Protein TOXD n=1 Tax=Aspergillus campestris (strain IBT 28561) TaxID=1392248 RepID=A0A2I1D737_ASPC2|nr:protein TOXD [Aspergillus campestris IBT 28561]PKY05700.1 protein TOXD [Aspergillus campestris IBT 28561]
MSPTQKALIVTPTKTATLTTTQPLPTLRDGYILVKTASVALNPTDWKHVTARAPPGVLVGCDYSGTVEALSPTAASSTDLKKGDRICGFAHGCNAGQPEDGAFAEYIVVPVGTQTRIPDNLSFQEAATLGVGVTTVGQALYQSLGMVLPGSPPAKPEQEAVLIYGASTATGALAVQFAKLSGYRVIATCSPQHFEKVRALGADEVFNSRDESAAERIREITGDKLRLCLDCVSLESTAAYCGKALSSQGGEYSALLPVKVERANVNSRFTMGYTAVGKEFRYGDRVFEASAEDQAFSRRFWALAEGLLAEGKGVLEGLEEMRAGRVSGVKLVYNVGETA